MDYVGLALSLCLLLCAFAFVMMVDRLMTDGKNESDESNTISLFCLFYSRPSIKSNYIAFANHSDDKILNITHSMFRHYTYNLNSLS